MNIVEPPTPDEEEAWILLSAHLKNLIANNQAKEAMDYLNEEIRTKGSIMKIPFYGGQCPICDKRMHNPSNRYKHLKQNCRPLKLAEKTQQINNMAKSLYQQNMVKAEQRRYMYS